MTVPDVIRFVVKFKLPRCLTQWRQIFTPPNYPFHEKYFSEKLIFNQKDFKKMNRSELERQKNQWLQEEEEIQKRIICIPDSSEDSILKYPFKIGGADISFFNNDPNKAVCCYVILEYEFEDQKDPKVLKNDCQIVELDLPYIASLLAFREAKPMVDMIKHQIQTEPELTPDYLMTDSNGILHPRKTGAACHVGVAVDIPTIGVAKNYFAVDCYFQDRLDPKSSREKLKVEFKAQLKQAGDCLEICHPMDQSVIGIVLKTTQESQKPCYVSIGHKISLSKAKALTLRTCNYKIPEPTRLADLFGREFIRKNTK